MAVGGFFVAFFLFLVKTGKTTYSLTRYLPTYLWDLNPPGQFPLLRLCAVRAGAANKARRGAAWKLGVESSGGCLDPILVILLRRVISSTLFYLLSLASPARGNYLRLYLETGKDMNWNDCVKRFLFV